MEKVKLESIIKEVAGAALREAIVTAKPKYKGLSDVELAEVFGLTEYQFTHFADKALSKAIDEKVEAKIKENLLSGNSLEIPNQFNVFVHESKVRKNENGTPVKKLSVRTRSAIKDALNQ